MYMPWDVISHGFTTAGVMKVSGYFTLDLISNCAFMTEEATAMEYLLT